VVGGFQQQHVVGTYSVEVLRGGIVVDDLMRTEKSKVAGGHMETNHNKGISISNSSPASPAGTLSISLARRSVMDQ
jgi:hypothetical protein